MAKHTGRYSGYIRPFSYLLDLIIINVLATVLLPESLNVIYYHVFISMAWVIISWNVGFYEVYRFTKALEIFRKIFNQYALFIILNFAYLGYFLNFSEPSQTVKFVTLAVVLISLAKFFIFYFLKRFRAVLGGNYRRVVLVGQPKNVADLADFFNDNPDYGYNLVATLDLSGDKKAQMEACFSFVIQNKIDEVYCSLTDVDNEQLNEFINFTDNNLKVLKFLPDSEEMLSRNMKFDYYGYIPVASLRDIPLDKTINLIVKRSFDVIFSLIVIVGILSWLAPILAYLIKRESKGPVFFKQRRNGLNYHEFDCYKFRSMRPNEIADLEQVSKNDPRITNIGRFIRKTSIDELPQFFNVLLGDMSVVGPRPHMVSHTEMYAKSVDKFMVRHFVKPGITGLAQTNGYRGEVESDEDIINRVKYDIFYLENWSLLLDLKIIFMTIYNAVKGEEKAY